MTPRCAQSGESRRYPDTDKSLTLPAPRPLAPHTEHVMTASPRTVAAIRTAFLDYFARHGHTVVASHSLLPPADPTLLFVNAGMVQFKDFFTGARPAPFKTATSTQKCLRVSGKHNDLENVGRTRRHHTLFEMLGNFSFGDYFKRGAIEHAWAFLTRELGLDPARLAVTYFEGNASVPVDSEARDLWLELSGLPADRIVPMTEKDNFWAMGDSGPCGPCTEIYWDLEPQAGSACTLAADDGRYVEIWNCVFMQYDRQNGQLNPLPAPCVDTGMGLERLAAVVCGCDSNYDTDVLRDLIIAVERLTGRAYGSRFDPENVVSGEESIEYDVALRVIADHARTTAFLMAEGIYPDADGRGYVLRRVMRRAIRYGRKIGLTAPFFYRIAEMVVDVLGGAFPELIAARPIIVRVARQEEERFGLTYAAGAKLIGQQLERIVASGQPRILPGEIVFRLHDSNGFPDDLTALICAEQGFGIDAAGFATAMTAQRARGKASWRRQTGEVQEFAKDLVAEGLVTDFVGYDRDGCEARVVALIVGSERQETATAGQVWLALDQSPCYAEGGGQVGDAGQLTWQQDHGQAGAGRITDTQKFGTAVHLHRVEMDHGTLHVGQRVHIAVNAEHRGAVRAHHSATHLLHKALRDVLGAHVKQRGSLVEAGRLRFDFSHFAAVTAQEMLAVELHVNQRVLANQAALTLSTSMDDAVSQGAMAFFGDKYGDVVRMMTIADSVELCGGTHVGRSGDIGLFKITSESAVSSGVRRVEAVCHLQAAQLVQTQTAVLGELQRRLGGQLDTLAERVDKLQAELRAAHQVADKWQAKALSGAGAAAAAEQRFGAVSAVFQSVEGADAAALRTLGDQVRDRIGTGVVALLADQGGGKALLLVATTKDSVAHLPAGALIAGLAGHLGGRGGGRPDLAQAGGTMPADVEQLRAAFFAAVAARAVG